MSWWGGLQPQGVVANVSVRWQFVLSNLVNYVMMIASFRPLLQQPKRYPQEDSP